MAAREHSRAGSVHPAGEQDFTRRDVLGAGALGTAVLRHGVSTGSTPAQDERDRARWARARAELARAEAEMAAFRAAEPKGIPFEVQCALDEAFSALGGRHDRAVGRLLAAPAPDLPALALKIGLAIDQQAWELPEAGRCLAALRADAARLCL